MGISATLINAGTSAGDVVLDGGSGSISQDGVSDTDDVVADSLSATSTGAIDLDVAVVSLTLNSSGSVTMTESDGLQFAGASSTDSLSLTTGGSLSNAAAASLAVENLASLSGTSIDLGGETGDTLNAGTLTFASSGAVVLSEDSDTVLAGTNTASSLDLDSTGSVTDADTATINVVNLADFAGTSITLGDQTGDDFKAKTLAFASAGAVAITEDSDMAVVTSSADGLNLNAGTNDITQTGTITAGATSLTGSAITLGSANALGAITVTSGDGDVSITEANDVLVASITRSGTSNSVSLVATSGLSLIHI